MNAKIETGDLILCNQEAAFGSHLLAAGFVSGICTTEDYYWLYPEKRAKLNSTVEGLAGDALYYRNANGIWWREPSPYHNTISDFQRDIRRRVFICSRFWYWGSGCQAFDYRKEYPELVCVGRGFRYREYTSSVKGLISYLENAFPPTITNIPIHRQNMTCGSDKFSPASYVENLPRDARSDTGDDLYLRSITAEGKGIYQENKSYRPFQYLTKG